MAAASSPSCERQPVEASVDEGKVSDLQTCSTLVQSAAITDQKSSFERVYI